MRAKSWLLTLGLFVGCSSDEGGGSASVTASTDAEVPSSSSAPTGVPLTTQASEPDAPTNPPGSSTDAEPPSSTSAQPPTITPMAMTPTPPNVPTVQVPASTMEPTPSAVPNEPGGQGGIAPGASDGEGGEPNLDGAGGTSASAGAGGRSLGAGGDGGMSGIAGASGDPTDVCDPQRFSQVLTVNADGGADFDTVQAAVDSLDSDDSAPVLVQIAPGSYKEKLAIADRSFITFCGESAESTVLTFDLNNEAAGGTSASASTTIDANDFSAVNITFENRRPMGSGQAVAILLRGERQQFLDCRFMGFQDTLYVHHGTQYFRNCYVQGTVDYVFGGSAAVLEDCTLYNAGSGSAVTAPNTELTQRYGIVFLRGELTASDDLGPDSVALGRPWGADGSATFIETVLGDYIKRVGWVEMSGNSPSNARFAEYRTTGPGASPESRVQGSRQLTDEEAAEYTLENILAGWTPSFSER